MIIAIYWYYIQIDIVVFCLPFRIKDKIENVPVFLRRRPNQGTCMEKNTSQIKDENKLNRQQTSLIFGVNSSLINLINYNLGVRARVT